MSKDTHLFYTVGDMQFKNINLHHFCGREDQMIYPIFNIQHAELMMGTEAQKVK